MDYYIGPNGELYHGLFGKGKGKPRDDHKYIKREWKNGRWRYTYKQDVKTKSSSSSSSSAGNSGVKGAVYINAREKGKSGAKLANAMSTYNDQIKKAATFMKAYDRIEKKQKQGPNSLEDDVKALVAKVDLINGADKALKEAEAAKKKIGKLVDTKSQKPHVSKEYQEELAYNSKKNDGSVDKTSTTKQSPSDQNRAKMEQRIDAMSPKEAASVRKWNEASKVSKEYQEEMAYNSQKNQYPNGDGAIKETVIPEKVIKETVIPESFITESNSSNSSEKKESWANKAKESLDNLGDWASDKLSDVGEGLKELYDDVAFEVSFAAEEAVDWVDDRLDDLHGATIGKVKDSLGYDERTRVYQAAQSRNRDLEPLIGSVNNITQDQKRLSRDDKNADAKSDIEDIDLYWFEENYVDYVSSSAAYIRAKKQYSETALGKIDQWVNGTSENHNDAYQQWQISDYGFYDVEQVRKEAKLAANWVRLEVAEDSYREAQRDMLAYKARLDELNKNSRANRDEIERYARLHSEAKQAANSAKRVCTTLDAEVNKLYSEYRKSYPSAIDDPDARLYQILDVLRH